MRRPFRITLMAVAAAILAAVLSLAVLDSNLARGMIERTVAARTGRTFEIGDLDIEIRSRPRIVAESVRLANPPWAEEPYLFSARRVTATFALPALLAGRVRLHDLELDEPTLALEVRDGERSWSLGAGEREGRDHDEPPRTPPRIDRIRVHDGRIVYLEPEAGTRIQATLEASGSGAADDASIRATGKLNGEALEVGATGPGILRLLTPGAPYELRGTARAGATRARFAGRIGGVRPVDLDLDLDVAGDNLASLRLLGLNAPATPPYSLAGRLRRTERGWHFDDAQGRIGDSDVAGWLAFVPGPRPLLTAAVRSNVLDFDDLGPLVGAPPRTRRGETASPQQRREARELAAAGRALPDKPFEPQRLRRMDADVTVVGKRVLHPRTLPIDSLEARVVIEDGVLDVHLTRLGMAGGRVEGVLRLDAREPTLRGSADLELRELTLARLFPTVEAMRRAQGVAHGRVRLSGRGNSIARLLGSSDGRITLAVDRGRISNLVLELLGLDAGEAALLFAGGDRQIRLRCAVADLDVRDGLATSDVLVLDTADTLIVGAGVMSFPEEKLDLTLHARPKDRSVLAARAPLRVRGSLRDPQVVPDPGTIAAKGLSAALLGLVNPLLALLPFIEIGPGKDSDCADLVARARRWSPAEQRPRR